jgi:hypothetical protein
MCNRCGRTIRAPAVPIDEVGAAYGPRCAALMGYMPSRPKRSKKAVVRRSVRAADARQMEFTLIQRVEEGAGLWN